jgi:hypothetical protein
VQLERADALCNAKYQISIIKRTEIERLDGQRQAFGDWFVSDVTTDTIERYREVRRVQGVSKDSNGVERISGGLVAANRDLALLRGCWNWAIRLGYVEKTPFKRGSEAVIKLSRESSRSRRLDTDEADRLLAACGASAIDHRRRIGERRAKRGAVIAAMVAGPRGREVRTLFPGGQNESQARSVCAYLDAPEDDLGHAPERCVRSAHATHRVRLRERDRPTHHLDQDCVGRGGRARPAHRTKK